jgi:iron complex outermembrane receptor protein
MDWNNVQLLFFNPVALGNTTFGVNGPNYNVKGVEAQVVGRVTSHLTIQGSGSYNDAKQSSSPCLIDNIQASTNFGKCITDIFSKSAGAPVSFPNLFGATGTVPAFSPKFEGNLRATYNWDINDQYRASAMFGVNYTGSMFNQPATYESGAGVMIPDTTYLRYLQPAYTTEDASIKIATDKYFVELYGTNLGNSHASVFTSSAQFIKSEVPLRPRVIAMRVGVNF